MKNSNYRNLAIHSTLIFILAFILNTSIHEGAHALMGKAFGLTTVLHHNHVSTSGEENSPMLVKILVPAAGPLMSLIQGIIFLILVRLSKQRTLLSLFFLWMCVMGFINIGGYLMMTPLFSNGDTGRVFSLLNSPEWLKWVVAGLALLALVKVITSLTPDFENQVPANLEGQPEKHGRLANLLIFYPVVLGSVATTILSFPFPAFLSILYPTTSPFVTFMIYGKLRRKSDTLQGEAQYPGKISLSLLGFTLAAIVVNRFLVLGITL